MKNSQIVLWSLAAIAINAMGGTAARASAALPMSSDGLQSSAKADGLAAKLEPAAPRSLALAITSASEMNPESAAIAAPQADQAIARTAETTLPVAAVSRATPQTASASAIASSTTTLATPTAKPAASERSSVAERPTPIAETVAELSPKQALSPAASQLAEAAAQVAAPASPPTTATDLTRLDQGEQAIAPVTEADPLTVVEIVEPGTGAAWLPAQSASALTQPGDTLAQVPANPQATTGWYVSLAPEYFFGYDIDTDGDDVTVAVPIIPAPGLPPIGTNNVTIPLDASIDTDGGFGISGAFGYRFNNARAEIEVGYNGSDVESVTVNDVENAVDGSINTWRFLLNGYYDFSTGSRFRPYVGGGAGLAILTADDVSTVVPLLGELSIDDSSASFVFQFKAGVGYDVTDELNAFLGYRLTGIPGQSFEALGTDLEADTLYIHSLQLGARYEF